MFTSSSPVQAAPGGLGDVLRAGLERIVRHLVPRVKVPARAVMRARANGLAVRFKPLVRGNPEIAPKLYRGEFSFHGTDVRCDGRKIFSHLIADEAWSAALHGFEWLAHMRAGRRELWRAQARTLIADWIAHDARHPAAAWRGPVVASRVKSWVVHAPFVLEGASEAFAARFFASLTRQTRRLLRARSPASGDNGLAEAVAVAYAVFGLSGLEALRAGAVDGLERSLGAHILADGGHVSRNPARVVDIALDLMPLRQGLIDARMEVPAGLNRALERMVPFVRFACHGDGGLAAFNGVGAVMAAQVRAIIEADEVRGAPLRHARHSAYCRLSEGASVLIASLAGCPPPGANRTAGLDAMAFEFSQGAQRIVVNCGQLADGAGHGEEWRRHACMAEAHSSLTVGQRPPGRLITNALIRRLFAAPVAIAPPGVVATCEANDQGSLIEMGHDGYVAAFGVRVQRRLFLARGGRDLRGEDRFVDAGDKRHGGAAAFTARFHLHPSVKATLAKDGASVMLVLPGKKAWRFVARGGRVRLEESVYMAGQKEPRRTVQITVCGDARRSQRILWAFKQVERRKSVAKEAQNGPELPL